MPDTLSQMSLKVLARSKISNDSSTPSTNAITDIKAYINTRAKSVWERRLWREYIILGTYSVPASTQRIALTDISVDSGFGTSANGYNGTFAEVGAIREGTTPLLPEDIGAINNVDADQWSSTTSPIRFISRGANGIHLLGSYSTATTLSFWGKAKFQDLTDAETWCLGDSDALIHGAVADMFMYWWEDQQTAMIHETKFENAIRLLVDRQEVQGANKKRIIPRMEIGGNRGIDYRFKTGIR